MNFHPLVAQGLEPLRPQLEGSHVFITGGTGFFGKTLLRSIQFMNREMGMDMKARVLSRNPDTFLARHPEFSAESAFTFAKGDVADFNLGPAPFTHVIHAATDASTSLAANEPLAMIDTIVAGTRRVLDYARACGAKRFLLTSSGAVYGTQPPDLTHIPETCLLGPDINHIPFSYHEGKRLAELIGCAYHRQYGLEVAIARCFAFVGPYLPTDGHFAIGNFMGDVLAGRPIVIKGDGTPFRSYLDARDLVTWLWHLLCRGTPGRSVNVGSPDAISLADLATLVSAVWVEMGGDPVPVEVRLRATPGALPPRYVPSVDRAREELGLTSTISLREAIRDALSYHLERSRPRP